MDLDPAHLRSFDAVVRHGGYHRAAEALHLTQPAVSRHIRRLEGQLGEPLFRKRGRGVELTDFGARAAEELANVLQANDRALARLLREGQAPFRVRRRRQPVGAGAAGDAGGAPQAPRRA